MNKIFALIFTLCRVTLGGVFIFSGFVKGIDPLGSAYKFNDYFSAAGMQHLSGLSLVLSFLLSGAEFLIGVALLTGIYRKLTAWTALFFMAFFTILTLILAIFNPVTDCGCFGDAIKLTNWETFYKNVILSVIVLFVFIFRNQFKTTLETWVQRFILVIVLVSFAIISIHSYRYLPLIDFMPYSVGTDIKAKMAIPAGAPKDEYETRLVYKNLKSGELKEFSMQNYPWQDTLNWKWADTKNVLIKKGYTPPIHDFAITSSTGMNITDSILNDPSYVFLFIAYNINKSNTEAFNDAEKLYSYCLSTKKASFYAISASANADIDKVRKKASFSYSFCSADETMLKTMIRSNPGIILLKNGTVIGKWHYNAMNQISLKSDNLLCMSLAQIKQKAEMNLVYFVVLLMAFTISIIWGISLYTRR